jgi:dihydrofolate reductase
MLLPTKGAAMAKVVGDISVSLDGFVTGPDPDPAHGLGHGGEGIHTWVMHADAVDRAVLSEATDATGAVIMGRNLFDVVDGPQGWTDEMGYGAGEAGQQPVFVVTRRPPAQTRLGDRFTFVVDGLASAVAKAAAVAEERDVVVMGGAATVRSALDLGLLDELKLHVSPVLVGSGTPLFTGAVPRALRQIHVRASGHATHVTYRVD